MAKKALTVSIVIPVYNEERHIAACLDSIAAQTVLPDEVIVVDNNSTDKTVAIAQSFPFVRVVSEVRQGVVYARNNGFDAASGALIGRIDADTVLPAEWVRTVKEIFMNDEIAAATGPVYFYDMPLVPVSQFLDHIVRSSLYKGTKNFPFLFGTNMAIRREDWHAVRHRVCSDKSMHEDQDLAIHLAERQRHIAYRKELIAGASARRFDDSPKKFRRYIKMQSTTYYKHGYDTLASNISEGVLWLGYIVFQPLRRSYDPQTKQRSLRHMIKGNPSRKNPMH